MTYRAGQTVELFTPAHPYWDNRVNIMDRSFNVPAVTERLRIRRVTRQPNGDVRLTLRRSDNTGFAIVVQHWLDYYKPLAAMGYNIERTIRVV